MKVRHIIVVTVALVLVLTAINLLTDNLSLLSKLPENRIDQARLEALQKPFTARPHRLERRPRLEVDDLQQEEIEKRRTATKQELGSAHLSQRLKAMNTADAKQIAKQRNKYHVVPTVDGRVYTEWQIRVCYYRYKQVKEKHPDSALGGFTRLLHSGKPDHLMEEIPTVVVDALPAGMDQGFVVLNRPFGFLQWVRKHMHDIPEDYILMSEPDHIFVRPMPLWATPTNPAAYPFSYIEPQQHEVLINRFNDKHIPLASMAPIGNAPVQIHKAQFESIVETWYNTSLRMKQDPEVDRTFNWILEMYAFSIASSQAPQGPLVYDLHPEMMGQPPFDGNLDVKGMPISLIHFTYGMDYDRPGNMVYGHKGNMFHWDKRDYSEGYPPRNLPLPPPEVHAPAVEFLLKVINEASSSLNWQPQQSRSS